MTVDPLQFVREFKQNITDRSLTYAVQRAGLDVFNGVNFTVTSRYPIGKNIFSEEWDLLLVLDACRVDAMREVADEYPFITDVDTIWSVGSSSHEWTVQTFSTRYKGEIEETALISTNPFATATFRDELNPPYQRAFPIGSLAWNPVRKTDFAYFEVVSTDRTNLGGNVPPSKATDRAIDIGRQSVADRMVVHYFQPHRPFISRTDDPATESKLVYDRPYNKYEAGEISHEELWEGYIENLRAVLDSVGLLLKNIEAERVVITADHGQLIGELGLTGHPPGLPHPAVKRVPWVETTATDEGSYQPQSEKTDELEEVDERLRNLGYI
ncbi:hypothetical protein IL252_00015 [Halomicrobium sp. IBSBa]|uniref:hypothetical protein n=1 Tax=Halomicrobium sp. IBSBa TaxID=2778916 RepID=UPI001ABFEAFD|nr:hypothetical protein [Halomicrobium sp. IBSBa]MBO4246198.1 hypothetical protein [Halomicrobium sp. IBSBa]